jgi:hypothetical protein
MTTGCSSWVACVRACPRLLRPQCVSRCCVVCRELQTQAEPFTAGGHADDMETSAEKVPLLSLSQTQGGGEQSSFRSPAVVRRSS